MRIIVADDEPDFRTLAMRELRREFEGADIAEVGDQPSLDAALNGPTPDLLVSDYSMKWTDGFALLASVRRTAPQCTAVMFTGTGNEELAVRAIKAGFDDYVVKSPRQFRRLAAATRTALDRAAARRELEQTRDLLISELYHRLHNNLQLVTSLIAFTARAMADRDARLQLEHLSRRVQALSLLQERFYRGSNLTQVAFGQYLRRLAEDLIALHHAPVTLHIAGEDVTLPVDVSVPLGLIANELVSNALRHGVPAGTADSAQATRTLAVGIVIDARRWCVLEVSDNGPHSVGFSDASRGGGLGMRLVGRLAEQLKARLEITPAIGGGTRCTVAFAMGDAPR